MKTKEQKIKELENDLKQLSECDTSQRKRIAELNQKVNDLQIELYHLRQESEQKIRNSKIENSKLKTKIHKLESGKHDYELMDFLLGECKIKVIKNQSINLFTGEIELSTFYLEIVHKVFWSQQIRIQISEKLYKYLLSLGY